MLTQPAMPALGGVTQRSRDEPPPFQPADDAPSPNRQRKPPGQTPYDRTLTTVAPPTGPLHGCTSTTRTDTRRTRTPSTCTRERCCSPRYAHSPGARASRCTRSQPSSPTRHGEPHCRCDMSAAKRLRCRREANCRAPSMAYRPPITPNRRDVAHRRSRLVRVRRAATLRTADRSSTAERLDDTRRVHRRRALELRLVDVTSEHRRRRSQTRTTQRVRVAEATTKHLTRVPPRSGPIDGVVAARRQLAW